MNPETNDSQRNILRTAKGGGFLVGGSIFEFASRFVIAFFLARLLGATDYGLLTLAISAATLFASLSALGLDDAMVRYVAILNSRKDPAGVLGTLQIGIGISTLVGVAMGGVLYFAAAPISAGLFDEPALVPLLRVFAIIVPFLTLSNTLVGVARGFKRMDYSALAENVVQFGVRMVLIVALAITGLNAFAAAVIFGISDVASSVVLLILLNREFPVRSLRKMARRDYGEIFRFSLPLWLSGALRKFRQNMQTFLLGALGAISDVGIFAIVARVNVIGSVVYSSIITSVKPEIAEMQTAGDRDGLAHLYRTATRWTLMFNLPFFLIMVLFPEQLLSIFGKSFTAGAVALIVLAVAELINAGTGICGSVLDMTGHTGMKLANSVLWLVSLLGTNVLLIPKWGIAGAAVATLTASALVNVARIVQVWVLERVQPYDRTFWKPLTAGLGGFLAGLALTHWLPPGSNLLNVALQSLIVVGIYVGLTVLLGVAHEDRMVTRRVFGKVGALLKRTDRTPRLPVRPK